MSTGQANPNFGLGSSSKVLSIFSGDYAACDEGSYFVSTLANTASTAVACTTQALADTNPAIAIYNGQPATGGGFNLYLRYIKIRVTAVGGTNTSKNYSSIVEQRTDKLSTTGTVMGTPANMDTGANNLAQGVVLYGGVNIAASANSTQRRTGDGQVRGAVEVAFDDWTFDFGAPVMGRHMSPGTATLLTCLTIPVAPVKLAPGWWYTLGFWGASQAAAADTYGIEVGFILRPTGQ